MRQFSLRYLLLEVTLFSIAFGLLAALPYVGRGALLSWVTFSGIVALGAAVGGLFGRMFAGVIILLIIVFISWWVFVVRLG